MENTAFASRKEKKKNAQVNRQSATTPKAYGGMKTYLHAFLTSEAYRGLCLASRF
jgi:hypothetical protein